MYSKYNEKSHAHPEHNLKSRMTIRADPVSILSSCCASELCAGCRVPRMPQSVATDEYQLQRSVQLADWQIQDGLATPSRGLDQHSVAALASSLKISAVIAPAIAYSSYDRTVFVAVIESENTQRTYFDFYPAQALVHSTQLLQQYYRHDNLELNTDQQ